MNKAGAEHPERGATTSAERAGAERVATRVVRDIVNDIRDGGLRPGTRLEPEHVMVRRLGVARGTVREALRFLELQGAVQMRAGPHGGPVVSTPGVEHLGSALSLQLQFAHATFRAVLEARRSIYPVITGEAAAHADAGDVAELTAILERLRAAVGSSADTTRESRLFHERVAQASRNVVLGFLVCALHRISEQSGIEYDERQRAANVRQSARLLRAIADHDVEEARALSIRMHAAAFRYWERHAPDQLNAPVRWLAS